MRNPMLLRINREDSRLRRQRLVMRIGILFLFIGAIICSHNTVYASGVFYQPILNLLIGLPIVGLGAWVYRRYA